MKGRYTMKLLKDGSPAIVNIASCGGRLRSLWNSYLSLSDTSIMIAKPIVLPQHCILYNVLMRG